MQQTHNHTLPKKINNAFTTQLKNAHTHNDVEKAVERAVINLLEGYYATHPQYGDVVVSYPHHTDGLVTAHGSLFSDTLRVLVEAKRDKDFTGSRKDLLETVAQVVSYLHTFRVESPDLYPQAVVVADADEIFLMPTKVLEPYVLSDKYDFSLPASRQHEDIALMMDLSQDKNIRPVVHNIATNFQAGQFVGQLTVVAQGAEYAAMKVEKRSLGEAFGMFREMVFGTNDSAVIGVDDRTQIELFSRTLSGDDEVYAHPKKPNVVVLGDVEIGNVSVEGYEQFSVLYDANRYSLSEYKVITEMSDTLLEEANRRLKGDFYTPKIWVDEAHRLIEDALGADWRDEYVVWDMASGTKNLTRDYGFGELYSSTLYAGELLATRDYNVGNVAFQYDFLNDDLVLHDGILSRDDICEMDDDLQEVLKLPVSLVRALCEKKPIVFFANPPYGQATDQDGAKKKGISTTGMSKLMSNLGTARQELYTQFIYRVQLLAKLFEYEDTDQLHFFFFNKGFLTSPNFGKFVDSLTSQFSYREGFMLNAGEFSGTSSAWGIIFSHWSLQGEKNQREFLFDVKRSTDDGVIEKIDTWMGKKVEKKDTITAWLNEVVLSDDIDIEAPLTKNGIDAPTSKSIRCVMRRGWIGYLHNNGNNVQYSDKYTGMYSMGFSGANGRDITPDNFTRACVTFSIRRSVQEHIARNKQLWIRDKDIFTRPSEDLLTEEFIADCVVYSLFDRQSNQTSLRDYQYNGNSYRVINEFFPFSQQFINDLAEEHKNMKLQVDLQTDHERYTYLWLEEYKQHFSQEAQALLDLVQNLYKESFKYREYYASVMPRYNTNAWDAGFVQISRMCFGQDRFGDGLLHLKDPLYAARAELGEKIALAAFEDGVI